MNGLVSGRDPCLHHEKSQDGTHSHLPHDLFVLKEGLQSIARAVEVLGDDQVGKLTPVLVLLENIHVAASEKSS